MFVTEKLPLPPSFWFKSFFTYWSLNRGKQCSYLLRETGTSHIRLGERDEGFDEEAAGLRQRSGGFGAAGLGREVAESQPNHCN